MGACAAVVCLWPTDAAAQRRGRVGRRGGAVVVASPFFFGGGFYDPFWGGGWGWGPGYPPYGPGYGRFAGAARLQITPKTAEVYVDGYLAGSVDDFDGYFQRLDVAPGEHELTVYQDGFQPLTRKVLFQPGDTIDIEQRLQPLAPGETSGPRPTAATPPSGSPDPSTGAPPSAFGTLAIRVQPTDATLLVDGEEWSAPEGDGPILIDLSNGPHEIEVRRDGLPAYTRTVVVRAGRTLPLNVSLSR